METNLKNDFSEDVEGVLATDFDGAKEIIAKMLKGYASLDVISDIILYNTDTYQRFFWSHPWSPNYECENCRTFRLEERGYDCEGKECVLCPHYSIIPKGFDKFFDCKRIEGRLVLDECHPVSDEPALNPFLDSELLEELRNM